jgi:uncharacterized membrane protein
LAATVGSLTGFARFGTQDQILGLCRHVHSGGSCKSEAVTPALLIHIAAGGTAILSGAAAVWARKGDNLHRAFGTVFFLCMLVMSAVGAYLATVMPHTSVVPREPTIMVGVFTFYLVATAWAAVKRSPGQVGLFERVAMVVAAGAAACFVALGFVAATGANAPPPPGITPYFVFASFAAFAAAADFSMIARGGLTGVNRIARHLWRMCFAFFFATSFFFVGQQKVMPTVLHGSPVLLALALAPLALMIFWLIRVRFGERFRSP